MKAFVSTIDIRPHYPVRPQTRPRIGLDGLTATVRQEKAAAATSDHGPYLEAASPSIEWGQRRQDRIAPAGSRHPPHRTGRAPFKASGSPSDGLDQSREHQPSAIVVGCIHPFSGVVRSVPHPSDCPPSPCGRLSRPRTTTGALPHDRHWPKLAYSVAGEPNMVPKFT